MTQEMRSLYEITADIKDINTVLVQRDRLEKAEKDAARYRWWTEVIESGELERLEKAFEPLGDADTTTKKEIDAVLDAAMEASK